MRSLLAALLAPLPAALSCSSSPPPEPIPSYSAPDPRRAKDDQVVALWNGQPLTWRAVAERAMDAEPRRAVDQYVRWRLVEDRKAALGIAHAPEEILRRAEAVVRETREALGETEFQSLLSRGGFTAESYLAHLRASPEMAETFALEKLVRYEALVEGWVQIDWMVFAREEEARRFAERCAARGFEAAAAEPPEAGTRAQRLRERFAVGLPPADPALDAPIAAALGKMRPGDTTAAQASRTGLFYVIRLMDARPGRALDYETAKAEVLESILSRPPTPQECRNWVEREFRRSKVEYAERRPRDGRGP